MNNQVVMKKINQIFEKLFKVIGNYVGIVFFDESSTYTYDLLKKITIH